MTGRLDRGYWRAFGVGTVDVNLHWSVPIGAICFGQLRLAPAAWLAFGVVLVAHALGHGLFVRAVGGRAVSIYLTGLGGDCSWTGDSNVAREALVAAGGVLGQLVVLVIALVASFVDDLPPEGASFSGDLIYACIAPNLALALANLLPIPGFDGARLWSSVPPLFRRPPPPSPPLDPIDDPFDDDAALDDPEVDEVVEKLLRDASRRKDEPPNGLS